jgi:hypothetical protein
LGKVSLESYFREVGIESVSSKTVIYPKLMAIKKAGE